VTFDCSDEQTALTNLLVAKRLPVG